MMMAIYHTLKAINQRLTVYLSTVKEPSKLSPQTINGYGVQYSSVCDVIFVINDKESSLYFAIFAHRFNLTTYTIYLLGIVIREGKIKSIILQTLWVLYNLSCIMISIEACHYVKSEMEKSKAIICKVAAKSANKRVLQEAIDILQQLSLVKNIFSPLGAFSLTRTFIVTSFSVVTTFVVILIQFNLLHE
ncbi:uncharacterized protein LOC121725328 [Aricia agestis]|uniref:uncharacterized protein LOC121725328 n=1 Tax=Aricia agestis TaxID=91739 RepID=UPI001C2092FC|nr:uncharacterized protein LOC121725328 [Aricia agestis]